MNETCLVQVQNLSRFYGDHRAVHDLSFEIHRGEVLGFLGPNGAGKSTTMQIISGNLAPSAGQVIINGYDILDQPRRAKAEIGYLPEQPPLYRELTVDEYLRYCARINRIPRPAQAAAVDRVKQRCGLDTVGKRLIGNLSKGFQQRVGIAQAIIHSPAVVILDEPTVGLDPIQIREIRALIRELGGDHSVILSTHILPEVQTVCDRVQIIHQGEMILNDSIAGLQQRMQSSALNASFRSPPAAAALLAIPGVVAVESDGDHGDHFHIRYRPEQDPVEAIVEAAVQGGWRLYEIVHDRLSLEQIFVDITRNEHAEQGSAPALEEAV